MDQRRPQLRWAPLALLAFVGAVACNNAEVDPAPGIPTPEDPAPEEPAPGPASVTVPTSTAAPGSAVTVQARGFDPNSVVEIGFGQPRSEYSVVTEARTDGAGSLETSVEIPSWAEAGQPYVVVVTAPDNDPREVSEPFVVGEAGDRVRVHGELTDEGVECPTLRGPFGTLYTLAVGDLEHGPGTEVMVEGTIAGMSICMQGTTIDVESLEPR